MDRFTTVLKIFIYLDAHIHRVAPPYSEHMQIKEKSLSQHRDAQMQVSMQSGGGIRRVVFARELDLMTKALLTL
jgi:ABC-type uncharacterized transport system ATPase subunit